jgi:hypothetical protein
MKKNLPDRKNRRCKGITKNGEPCGAAATAGGLCYFHANPNKASELGRIGGKKNRHFTCDRPTSLPSLDNPAAVRDMVPRLIADLYAGQLHPRTASALVGLMNLQLRAIESAELAERLAKMEKLHPPDIEDED